MRRNIKMSIKLEKSYDKKTKWEKNMSLSDYRGG